MTARLQREDAVLLILGLTQSLLFLLVFHKALKRHPGWFYMAFAALSGFFAAGELTGTPPTGRNGFATDSSTPFTGAPLPRRCF